MLLPVIKDEWKICNGRCKIVTTPPDSAWLERFDPSKPSWPPADFDSHKNSIRIIRLSVIGSLAYKQKSYGIIRPPLLWKIIHIILTIPLEPFMSQALLHLLYLPTEQLNYFQMVE